MKSRDAREPACACVKFAARSCFAAFDESRDAMRQDAMNECVASEARRIVAVVAVVAVV